MNKINEYKYMKSWLSIFRAIMSIKTVDLIKLNEAIDRELNRRGV